MTSRLDRAQAGDPGQVAEIERDAEQREARDEHARHRARLEGDVEAAAQGLGRGLRGAHVGADGDVHADEAGRAGQDGADGEADGDANAEQIGNDDEQDHADDGDGRVLPPQIGLAHLRRSRLRSPACAACRHRASSRR